MFLQYFPNLYQETMYPEIIKIIEWLQSVGLVKVSQKWKLELESPVLENEVQDNIGQLKKGRAVGLDGILTVVHKVVIEPFILSMTTLFNNILSGDTAPDTWEQENICLIRSWAKFQQTVRNIIQSH